MKEYSKPLKWSLFDKFKFKKIDKIEFSEEFEEGLEEELEELKFNLLILSNNTIIITPNTKGIKVK